MRVVSKEERVLSIQAGSSGLVGAFPMEGEIVTVETVPYNTSIKIYLKSPESDATVFQASGKGFFGLPGTALLWPQFKIIVENSGTTKYEGKIIIKQVNYI